MDTLGDLSRKWIIKDIICQDMDGSDFKGAMNKKG